jgi:chemotaxis protein histidine kinase CheA
MIEKLNPIKQGVKEIKGEKVYLKVEYQPIFEEQNLSRIMVICRDVTKQKLAEEHLLRSQKEKEQQVERVHALISNDKDGLLSLFNLIDESIERVLGKEPPADLREYVELYRAFHSIKGLGGSMGFSMLADVTHKLEDVLRDCHEKSQQVSSAEWQNMVAEFVREVKEIKGLREKLFANRANQMTVDTAVYQSLMTDIETRHLASVQEVYNRLVTFTYKRWGSFCERYKSLVASYAEKNEKNIEPLEVKNIETYVDPSVLRLLDAPLTHCIRNAVDHGIEEDKIREAAGKGPGKVTLDLHLETDCVHVSITDDGKGIDPAAVASAALRKGIISQAELEALSEAGRRELIFRPGFSTKEAVSEFSGRGFGMDIVKSTIDAAHGTVVVDSQVGRGTTIRLTVPRTGGDA